MGFSEILIKEHEPIRRAIHVLEEMTSSVENGVCVDKHDINALLLFLHYFADAYHELKQENILLPIFTDPEKCVSVDPDVREQVRELLREDKDERSAIEKTRLALFAEDPFQFIMSARKLAHLLWEHAFKEERVLFPVVEKLLTPKQADLVVMRIEEADAEFGCSQRTLLMELLQELETKYLRKCA
jgi:hemerythrin-like domain-containing protein